MINITHFLTRNLVKEFNELERNDENDLPFAVAFARVRWKEVALRPRAHDHSLWRLHQVCLVCWDYFRGYSAYEVRSSGCKDR